MDNITQLRSIIRAFVRQNEDINKHGCCLGITVSQCHALMEVGKEVQIDSKGLAQKLNLDKSTVSRTVDGMVKNGLLLRTIPPENRRSSILSLSKEGQSLFDQINGQMNAAYMTALGHLSKEEQRSFLHLFELFTKNLNTNTNGCIQ